MCKNYDLGFTMCRNIEYTYIACVVSYCHVSAKCQKLKVEPCHEEVGMGNGIKLFIGTCSGY